MYTPVKYRWDFVEITTYTTSRAWRKDLCAQVDEAKGSGGRTLYMCRSRELISSARFGYCVMHKV
jgi:hypothetical protein